MSFAISVLSKTKNLLPELQRVLPNIKFHQVENPETDELFKQSEIIVADFDLISPYLYDLPKIKWIQGTWAGVERLISNIKASGPPNYPITRFSGKHFGALMSEYVVSNIVNFERDAFRMKDNQKVKNWVRDGKISGYRSIFELTVGVLGVGTIGNRIAKTLNSMGAKIIGYGRRTNFNLEENAHISAYFNRNNLPIFLQSCDYVINVLPSTDDTIGLLNGNLLENCKNRNVIFINIGRGSVISEDCLVKALQNKWISGAILDVFEKEPLAANSLLWDMPNVIITPHVSGMSRGKDVAEQLKENLDNFQKGLPLPSTVDFSVGY